MRTVSSCDSPFKAWFQPSRFGTAHEVHVRTMGYGTYMIMTLERAAELHAQLGQAIDQATRELAVESRGAEVVR